MISDKKGNLWIAIAIDQFSNEVWNQKRQFYTVISYRKWYKKSIILIVTHMDVYKISAIVGIVVSFYACSSRPEGKIIIVKNTLNVERSFETVELTKDFLKVEDLSSIGIRDVETEKIQITQTVDTNGDAIMDQLLFQPVLGPTSEKEYEIITISEKEKIKPTEYCYSRFVPERTDDYAWENDKVAFRVFGPKAQQMVEDSIPGGTLSSGVDAWLKKVVYPIINKWYKKNEVKEGAYHEPSPEGLDNFHVGISRGIGGIAIKRDTTYYFSKNYTEYNTITTGPIRTSFYLNYDDWDIGGGTVKESKIISLDLGSNFSKFEIKMQGTNSIMAGLTLHEKDGEVSGNKSNNWVSYWQPHADSELGMAIIAPNGYFEGFETYETDKKDESHAYANLNVVDGTVVYYAGFGWKESGQFTNRKDWETNLDSFSEKINNPLLITLKEQ